MSRSAVRLAAVLILVALALAAPAAAQEAPGAGLGAQRLGRGYTHVFWAYALAWALILAWVVSIARRLARIEHRLDEDA